MLGTITVALIGLVALELFGATAGLIALVLAAVYPVLIELSTVLVAENLLTTLILAAVYAGLRAGRAARTRSALRLGRRGRGADRAGHAHPRERHPDHAPPDRGGVEGTATLQAPIARRRRRC